MAPIASFRHNRLSRRRRLGREARKILEGKNAGAVAVGPNGLDGVAADIDHAHESKGARGERLIGPLVEVPHDVPLSLAARARAMSAHGFQRDKTLAAIVPFDGQFAADLLDVRWLHAEGQGKMAAMVA